MFLSRSPLRSTPREKRFSSCGEYSIWNSDPMGQYSMNRAGSHSALPGSLFHPTPTNSTMLGCFIFART